MQITPQWIDPPQTIIPDSLRAGLAASNLLLESLVQRGIVDPNTAAGFLDYHLYTPASPFDFPGMQIAVERINTAIKHHERIAVWGDFDVDGQTSTAVLVSGLRKLGADVHFHVPIRSTESHGVKLEALKAFISKDDSLVITCDTGITAHDAAEYLENFGVDLIITDHHTLPEILPKACSIVNPHLLPEGHPMGGLAGVGAAYELIQAVFEQNGIKEQAQEFHDLVALGTIADLAPLTGDNRFLVQSGIDLFRRNPRYSLAKMAETAGFSLDQVTEEQISFYLAPRLNAVGRLEDANPLVEFLLSTDPAVVAVMVQRMEGLNAQRKLLVDQVFQGCLSEIDRDPTLLDHSLLILGHPEWPGGVVGIAASRLVEITHKPVILFNTSSPHLARGSARSVEGIDITAALTANQQFLNTFGGHAMAAGLSIDPAYLDEFRRNIERTVADIAQAAQIIPTLRIDAFQPLERISLDLLVDLDRLAPFGPGNPPLVFAARNIKLLNTVEIGRNGDHLQVMVEDTQGNPYRVLWWQGAGSPLPEGNFDLAYTARVNQYRGESRVQLEWLDFRPAAEPVLIDTKKHRRALQLIDFRKEKNIIESSSLLTDAAIFSEGSIPPQIKGLDRVHLTQPSNHLILLTIPPSPEVMRDLIRQVHPEKITFYGFIPEERRLSSFLSGAINCIKIQRRLPEQEFSLDEFAARFSVTAAIARSTLDWLAAKGKIGYSFDETNCIAFSDPLYTDLSAAHSFENLITREFEEMVAYQRYYLSAPLESLIDRIKN